MVCFACDTLIRNCNSQTDRASSFSQGFGLFDVSLSEPTLSQTHTLTPLLPTVNASRLNLNAETHILCRRSGQSIATHLLPKMHALPCTQKQTCCCALCLLVECFFLFVVSLLHVLLSDSTQKKIRRSTLKLERRYMEEERVR